MDTSSLLLISAVLRALLTTWGYIQDNYMSVKYTDIDYSVFTDAARYVAQGQSPFQRSTYRYSPLLAYLMVPNVLWTEIFGKVLFVSGDILAGWQIAHLCRSQAASPTATFWALISWLYNPFTATISTRGSCDVLVANLLLAVLQLLFRGSWLPAALLYGLAVQFRIYPIIYAPAIVLFLASRQVEEKQVCTQQGPTAAPSKPAVCTPTTTSSSRAATGSRVMRPNPLQLAGAIASQGLTFGLVSGGVFLGLNAVFYHLYGQLFLQEAFLHHLTRKDPRHNFSIYFYHIYLTFMDWTSPPGAQNAAAAAAGVAAEAVAASGVNGSAVMAGLLVDPSKYAFLFQWVLLLVLAVALHRHLPFCWLVQTMTFVAFNKVCTAQYFVWYFCLLPLVLPAISWPPPKKLSLAAGTWVVVQLHWLLWGYLLEFQGQPVYLPLWFASMLFLGANTWVMVQLMHSFRPSCSFLAMSLAEKREEGKDEGASSGVGRVMKED